MSDLTPLKKLRLGSGVLNMSGLKALMKLIWIPEGAVKGSPSDVQEAPCAQNVRLFGHEPDLAPRRAPEKGPHTTSKR